MQYSDYSETYGVQLEQGMTYEHSRNQTVQNLAANIALINNVPLGKNTRCADYYPGKGLVEGFAGLVRPTYANERNKQQEKIKQLKQAELQRRISSHATAHKALMDSTQKYITSASRTSSKNYNMLVNKHPKVEDIPATAEGCYMPTGKLRYQTDLGTNVPADVCKMRAYDLNSKVYGLSTKDGGCYVNDSLDEAKSGGPVMKTVISKSFSQSGNADVAQLLHNGQLGIFNKSAISQLTDSNVVKDLTAVGTCNMLYGGKIDVQSATYGGNCNNYDDTPDPVSQIKSAVRPNFCMQPSNNKYGGYPTVEAWDCVPGNTSQKITYNAASKQIVFGSSGQCLDVFGGRSFQGTPVIKYPCHSGANQKWDYNATQKTFRPQNAPGMTLDVKGGSGVNGTGLWIYQYNGTTAQQWNIIP
jgi:hypothetical protein